MDVEEVAHSQIGPTAYSSIGKMTYYNPYMDTNISISVSRDDYTIDKTVRIANGNQTIAVVAGWLVSAWLLPLKAAIDLVTVIFGSVLIGGVTYVVGGKSVTGTVTQYTWNGVPSDTRQGSTAYLD